MHNKPASEWIEWRIHLRALAKAAAHLVNSIPNLISQEILPVTAFPQEAATAQQARSFSAISLSSGTGPQLLG